MADAMFWLLIHMSVGFVGLIFSALTGNSARRMFSDMETFSAHVGVLLIWPLVIGEEIWSHVQQKRWERKQREGGTDG